LLELSLQPIRLTPFWYFSLAWFKKKIFLFYFLLRIFQRFRLVKFNKKFKTRFKNLKIQKIIAFDKYLHELFFALYFHLIKNLFLTLKNNEVADLTHFSTNYRCF